jgi:hypothetical protein
VLALGLACALLAMPLGAMSAAPGCVAEKAPPTATQRQLALRTASDRGFLWRLTKDGRTSWLYGTLHVGRWAWAYPGPALARAFAATDTLAVEIDLLDAAVFTRFTEAAQAARQRFADDPALRPRIRQLASCTDFARLAELPQPMQLMTLSLLAARDNGLDVMHGQDLMLGTKAHAERRPVVSLESVELQLGVLVPDDSPPAREMVEHSLRQLERGQATGVLLRLAQAWADGDLDTLARYPEWCACADTAAEREQIRRLIDERNPSLARAIDALHDRGRTVLAAVGALHMTGPLALPRLLADQGFVVRRVSF